ncbi:MAG: CoA transferase [Saprospiraceae bacterium]|nr:CoA transferase [Saprospiraceae bacterium]
MEIDQQSLFKGLKVVEFASVLAGPAVGMFFAELGAQVVKIENKHTGGDVTRGWKNPLENPAASVSAYFCSVNWGKKHLFLDLTDADDRQTAISLALEADIVVSNFKPSSARRMGVDAASLRAQNPKLIYAQLNSFADPEDESPAFDAVLQAEAGFLYMNGEQDRPPVKMPVALIDVLAAHQLKEGILMALLQREKTGNGCIVTTSLMESALASLVNQASNFLMNGVVPQRMGTQHPNIAPYGDVYTTTDGFSILLAVGTERQFKQLCNVLELEALLQMPEFQQNAARVKNRLTLNEYIQDRIRRYALDELIDLFKRNGVPAAKIRDMKQVFEIPTAQDLILEEIIENDLNTKRMKTIVFKMTS